MAKCLHSTQVSFALRVYVCVCVCVCVYILKELMKTARSMKINVSNQFS